METVHPRSPASWSRSASRSRASRLALFLWIAFGGPLPLKPEGYRFTVPFNEATQLAVQSDVRISGVSVGKVKSIRPGRQRARRRFDRARQPLRADSRRHAGDPAPEDPARGDLRRAHPGQPERPQPQEGGTLPEAQVADSVQLDEIFRTFNARTRQAFKVWMQGAAAALRGRGADLSAAIAELEPFAEQTNRLLRVLDSQRPAVQQLIRSAATCSKRSRSARASFAA